MKLAIRAAKGIFFALLMACMNLTVAFAQNNGQMDAWKSFFAEYRIVMAYIAGFGALTSILVFIYHFVQLGIHGDNPSRRQEILWNLFISAICTALLGGITTVLAFFYQFFLGK